MRALRRDVLPRLDLRTTGMEFASEMVIRAAKEKLEIRQFPIEYHPRGGESKLSSFRDGWRHLRFLLVHSPNHLFIFPGALMAAVGALIELIVIAHLGVFGREWDIHALIAGALLAIVGTQVVALGICAHAYGTYFMGEQDRWFDRMRARYRLEHGLLLGGAVIARRRRDRHRDRDRLDHPRLRCARRREPGRARRDADHRRHPDLLLVVPALDPRPAPPALSTRVMRRLSLADIYVRAAEENSRAILGLVRHAPGALLLDVGCGDGRDSIRLLSHIGAARVIGLELADHQVKAAFARGVDVRKVDLTQRWPLDDESVDVVHSNQVIEHLADTDHFMSEIRRVVRPEGYVVISTNNLASWHNILALVAGWQPLPCHVSDDFVVGNPLALAERGSDLRIHRHLRIFTSSRAGRPRVPPWSCP